MKCLVTETLSGEKDGAMAACVVTLQTIEEVGFFNGLFMRIGNFGVVDTSSLLIS